VAILSVSSAILNTVCTSKMTLDLIYNSYFFLMVYETYFLVRNQNFTWKYALNLYAGEHVGKSLYRRRNLTGFLFSFDIFFLHRALEKNCVDMAHRTLCMQLLMTAAQVTTFEATVNIIMKDCHHVRQCFHAGLHTKNGFFPPKSPRFK
jgi:hypothetical protein